VSSLFYYKFVAFSIATLLSVSISSFSIPDLSIALGFKAAMYKSVTFNEAIQKNLKIMDATAFTLCRDQKLPVAVFNIFKQDALQNILLGNDEGTRVVI
jgi:hypothetical protein